MVAGRATLACALCACLAVAACGGGEKRAERATSAAGVGGEPPATSPAAEATVQPLAYGRGVRAGLAGGRIAVVDLTNRAGIEPLRMTVNSEQTVSGLSWSGWGQARATGRGEVETLSCEPSCANGQVDSSRAEIVLSAPRRCGKRQFYTRSSMTYKEAGSGRVRAPDTYLRTPPC